VTLTEVFYAGIALVGFCLVMAAVEFVREIRRFRWKP